MSLELATMLYASLGLALTGLRIEQGMGVSNALFGGLFWPGEVSRHWIDWSIHALVGGERGTKGGPEPLTLEGLSGAGT